VGRAKDIVVKPIAAKDAREIIRALHYSGKVVANSQLHFGVFLDGKCGGALQFGPSLDKRKMLGLVEGTNWNEFIELNRMALAEWLPRNGESRAISVAMRLLRRHYPHLQWVVSFADGTQCGDGTIYRASGFVLTGIVRHHELLRLPSGEVVHRVALNTSKGRNSSGGKYGIREWANRMGGQPLPGHQLRYIYFLDPTARERLTVPIIPFSEIEKRGAGMYRGKPSVRSVDSDTLGPPAEKGRCNSDPDALDIPEVTNA
jgi:hypothetical protein